MGILARACCGATDQRRSGREAIAETCYPRRVLWRSRFLSVSGVAGAVILWQVAVAGHRGLIPGPFEVTVAIAQLARGGLLLRYLVASLFRVSWGYAAAVVVAIPLGVALGSSRRLEASLHPLMQLLRPISPLAWIPIAILWFGVGDLSAIFLIFVASLFPLTLATTKAVHEIDPVVLRAARNFAVPTGRLIGSVILPSILPQLVISMRITLGIAWLVVVAAEMIAVNSGLGFLIVDARNAGNRYDLVIAGMVMIGLIGVVLDAAMRALARLDVVQWRRAD